MSVLSLLSTKNGEVSSHDSLMAKFESKVDQEGERLLRKKKRLLKIDDVIDLTTADDKEDITSPLSWITKPVNINGSVKIYCLDANIFGTSAVESKDLTQFNFAFAQYTKMMETKTPKRRICQIDVLEYEDNHPVLQQYMVKKMEFKKKLSIDVVERYVFHGTDIESTNAIIQHGFIVGGENGIRIKNGKTFGNGVYFAFGPHSTFQYAGTSQRLILAVALDGECVEGYTGSRSSHLNLDSWKPHTDWVVYKSGHQALPKFIIHFR